MIDFNNITFNYKGYDISVCNHIDKLNDRITDKEVAIWWDEKDLEVVDYFNSDVDSLTNALNKAKELIDCKPV